MEQATSGRGQGRVASGRSLLKHDGLEIVARSNGFAVEEIGKPVLDFNLPYEASIPEIEAFIDQQVEKCDRKLTDGDYNGAITNARSFVESILLDLEGKLDTNPPKYDGASRPTPRNRMNERRSRSWYSSQAQAFPAFRNPLRPPGHLLPVHNRHRCRYDLAAINCRFGLVKIGAKVVRHGRYVTFQLAEVAIPRALFAEILRLIDRLRLAPLPP